MHVYPYRKGTDTQVRIGWGIRRIQYIGPVNLTYNIREAIQRLAPNRGHDIEINAIRQATSRSFHRVHARYS